MSSDTETGEGMDTQAEYIVICQQVVGNPESGYSIVYGHDGARFWDRKAAIRHGFVIRGSDDFNIGVLSAGKLTEFCWMDEPMDTEDLAHVAQNIGFDHE